MPDIKFGEPLWDSDAECCFGCLGYRCPSSSCWRYSGTTRAGQIKDNKLSAVGIQELELPLLIPISDFVQRCALRPEARAGGAGGTSTAGGALAAGPSA